MRRSLFFIALSLIAARADATRYEGTSHVVTCAGAQVIHAALGAAPSADHPHGTLFVVAQPAAAPRYVAEMDAWSGAVLRQQSIACSKLYSGGAGLIASCDHETVSLDASLSVVWRSRSAQCAAGVWSAKALVVGPRQIATANSCDGDVWLSVLDASDGHALGAFKTGWFLPNGSESIELALHGTTLLGWVSSSLPTAPTQVVVSAPGYASASAKLNAPLLRVWDDGAHLHVSRDRATRELFQLPAGGPRWLVEDQDLTLDDSLTRIAVAPLSVGPPGDTYETNGLGGDYVVTELHRGNDHYWLTAVVPGPRALYAATVAPVP